MKTPLIVALATMAILVAGACAPAATPVTIAPSQPTGISVRGEGSVTVKPDLAQVTLGVGLSAPPPGSELWPQLAEKMTAVVAKLKELGIEEKDIKTTRLTASISSSPVSPAKFGVANAVTVRVRDLDRLSAVLDGAMAAGANIVENLNFTVESLDALLQQARDKAMDDARAKAEQLAKRAGVRLGKAIRIEEGSPFPSPSYGGMGMGGGGVETPISPGETKVQVSVSVTYAIE